MAQASTPRPAWREVLAAGGPLLLPAAHDALTARLIERAGFKAYQIGGFALNASRHGFPDIDLSHFGEEADAARELIAACGLPVLIDADDGYGDVKNVTRTVGGFEAMGASALFIEDQKAPKKCGQMGKRDVIPAREMVLLGGGSAVALAGIDVVFGARGVIAPVYLIDAAAEAVLALGWLTAAARRP